MLSKRKALLGYVTYKAGKPIAKRAMKRKAKAVVGTRPGSRMLSISGIAAAVGAVVGGLLFWRKRKSRSGEPSES